MKRVERAFQHLHVVDTKLSESYKGGGGVGQEVWNNNIYKREHLGPGRKVWHTPDDFNIEHNKEAVEHYFKTMYDIGNRMVAIDEITDVADESRVPFSVRRMFTRARERKLGCLWGAQRLHGIPSVARTETEHWFSFFLDDQDDRDRMEKKFDCALPWQDLLEEEYSFMYRAPDGSVHGPFYLNDGDKK
jgi:hypothetical protein